jgi:hypothetical protein
MCVTYQYYYANAPKKITIDSYNSYLGISHALLITNKLNHPTKKGATYSSKKAAQQPNQNRPGWPRGMDGQ